MNQFIQIDITKLKSGSKRSAGEDTVLEAVGHSGWQMQERIGKGEWSKIESNQGGMEGRAERVDLQSIGLWQWQ
jgi:hypothetical protein